MFGFFRRKKPALPTADPAATPDATPDATPVATPVAMPDSTPEALPAQVQQRARAPGPQPAATSVPVALHRQPTRGIPVVDKTVVHEPASPVIREATRPNAPDHTAARSAVTASSAPPVAGSGAVPSPKAADTDTAAEAVTDATGAVRPGWLARLRGGLTKTRTNFNTLFVGAQIDEALYEELENALLASDAGVATSEYLLARLRERARRDRLVDAAGLRGALRDLIAELLAPLEQPVDVDRATPLVMMITGVNGAGKTTSIGKLARHLRAIDRTVLLAAADTFRAAAREQLVRWGERNQVQVIGNEGGDTAAVAFDAVKAGIARGTGVVMIDTAGRLPTQQHLMEELRKIRRVLGKAMASAPHEVLLVLDGNTGQNMLAQVKAFDEAVQLTGLIVTKLDGTAKGGAIAALAYTRRDRPIPVYFIGVGEGVEDLEAFSAKEFASALLD